MHSVGKNLQEEIENEVCEMTSLQSDNPTIVISDKEHATSALASNKPTEKVPQ